jgi:hypothetical protein
MTLGISPTSNTGSIPAQLLCVNNLLFFIYLQDVFHVIYDVCPRRCGCTFLWCTVAFLVRLDCLADNHISSTDCAVGYRCSGCRAHLPLQEINYGYSRLYTRRNFNGRQLGLARGGICYGSQPTSEVDVCLGFWERERW